jgi:GNAT superfamily N-acetyltransferase
LNSPGIAYLLLDGGGAAAREDDLLALAAEVHGGADAAAARRAALVRRRQPGFALAEARHGGYLVGYASGMPLRPSTSWWRGLTTPLPADVTTEHPGRTFALTELLVRASWRRQGIGRELHDLLLGGRAEERATALVPPGAGAAQRAFASWGWQKAGRARGDGGPADVGAPVADVMLIGLPVSAHESRSWLAATIGKDQESEKVHALRS